MRVKGKSLLFGLLYLMMFVLVVLFLRLAFSAESILLEGVGKTNRIRVKVANTENTFPKRSHNMVMHSGPRAYGAVNRTKVEQFRIVQPFVFPQPAYSRPTGILLRSPWVTELKYYLSSIQGNELSLVTSSVEHTDVLMNWLVASYVKIYPPLQNVLVLSMDDKLHNSLIARGIPSLYIHKDMVVRPGVNVPRVFSQVHVTRMALLRLINHYGYDVINYDCDAIPLKNPQPIFDKYKQTELIGTFGKGPKVLYDKWGVTLNTGVMVMRATASMEHFWQEMPYGRDPPITDDQNSINYCLEHMRVIWTNYNKTEKIEERSRDILGEAPFIAGSTGKKTFLQVMLMPYTVVCRHVCDPEKRDSYYVWHALAIRSNRTVANKKSQASVGNAWHLLDNWKEVSDLKPELQGTEWLRYISKTT